MSGREKGVASQPCPECGADLKVVTQPDGGVSTEACGSCYPAAKTEKASAQSRTTRERGTTSNTATATTITEESQ